MVEKVPREDLIDELQRLAEGGRAPSSREMDEHGAYSPSPYQRAFGSWLEAVDAAGLEPHVRSTPIPREELIDELQRLAEDGRAPSKQQMDERGAYSTAPYRLRFGSWLEAVDEAGLEPYDRSIGYPREDLIDELQRLAEDGVAPTGRQMDDDGAYSRHPYMRVFGSWIEAVEAAGLTPAQPEPIPREDLIDELQRLADDGVGPSNRTMRDEGIYSESPYEREFGTWSAACEAAGLKPAPQGRQDGAAREDLLAEMRRLAEDGHAPTQTKMCEEGAYSDSPYQRAFGSWDEAVEAAGLYEPVSKSLSPVMREALKAQRQEEAAVGGD